MSRSPLSRGKGSRRWPGRSGGLHKGRPVPDWERRCQHRTDDLSKLAGPFSTLSYRGPRRCRFVVRVYRFDQEMARLGVVYYADVAVEYRMRILRITVATKDLAKVKSAIERLEEIAESP